MREAIARIPDSRATWVILAGAAGLVVAAGASQLGLAGAIAALVVLGGLVAAAKGVLDVRFALSLSLVALPLDVYGRLIERPIALTAYQGTLFIALAAWALAIARGKQRLPRPSAVDAAMALFVIAGLWSLPHSLAPSATALSIARLVFIWAFVALISHNLRSEVDLRTFVNVLIATGVAGGLLALAQYMGYDVGNIHVQGPDDFRALSRVSGFFDDPNYFAGFLTACAVAAAGLLAHSKRWIDVLVYAAGVGICSLGVVLTFSRTAWLGLALGFVLVAFTAPRRVRFVLVSAGVAGVLLLVALQPATVIDRVASSFDFQGDESISTRIYMAGSMLDMIEDNPVWGTGLAAFDREYPYYRNAYASRTILRPHQIPLGLWSEAGIAGLIAQLGMLIAVGFTLFADRRKRPFSAYESVALAGIVCMSVQSLFQYYLYFEYLWLFVALAVAASRVARRDEEASQHV